MDHTILPVNYTMPAFTPEPQSITATFNLQQVQWYTNKVNKNSSGDEIANVNFFTTISHTYFKTPKREPISFNKLDDS